MTHHDLLIRGGTCVTPGGIVRADVALTGGKIGAIGDLSGVSAKEVIEAQGLHVLPGVIDTQVHFREPGGDHKEDLETGTRGAILGGVTAVFEMPNTEPPTTTADALQDKLRRARDRAWCHYAFYVGATHGNVGSLAALERRAGCAGIKVFMGSSTGTLLVPDDAGVEAVLRAGVRRVAFHSEDEERLKSRAEIAVKEGHPRAHPVWRDAECARRSTERLLGLARKCGRRIHLLHTTTAEEMELVRGFKDLVTVEVTPQHLTLVAPECYEELGTLAQMNPPLREERHRRALWDAVVDGRVDVIGSDHAPHTREEKARPYPGSPSGMPGVQTLLPVLLDHHAAGRVSLERVVDLTSSGPARVFGIVAKGRLVVGYDADLVLVDLRLRREVTHASMATRVGWTPFVGHTLEGWPLVTILGGDVVMRDGEVLGSARGRPVRFLDTLRTESDE